MRAASSFIAIVIALSHCLRAYSPSPPSSLSTLWKLLGASHSSGLRDAPGLLSSALVAPPPHAKQPGPTRMPRCRVTALVRLPWHLNPSDKDIEMDEKDKDLAEEEKPKNNEEGEGSNEV
ncbi:hypothetical protein K488DRAFT_92782 [Vararia minispora EC-137]|uniref:Uncharacterized protein n=1 Tax=Vararia minispora EC-137 TaxID=1314806 RepID=A0ACB8Q3Q5_9AGAM|nr:hypothetical protein K488DRAFT_92782 [Vararia minispora EC-137]